MHASRKELVILGLLRDGRERYGLELVRASAGDLIRSSIYVQLTRAEEKGFVDSRKEELPQPAERPPRRLYRITGAGERALLEAQKHVFGPASTEVVP